MKVLIYILRVIGTLIYGVIAAYLLWLLFYYITPYIMGINNWLLALAYLFIGNGIVASLLKTASGWITLPLGILTKNNLTACIVMAAIFLFHGYSAVADPWRLALDYTFLKCVLAISLNITAFSVFGTMIIIPFTCYMEGNYEPKTQPIEKHPQKYDLGDRLTLLVDGKKVYARIAEPLNADGMILVETEIPINGRIVAQYTEESIDSMIIEHNGQSLQFEYFKEEGISEMKLILDNCNCKYAGFLDLTIEVCMHMADNNFNKALSQTKMLYNSLRDVSELSEYHSKFDSRTFVEIYTISYDDYLRKRKL